MTFTNTKKKKCYIKENNFHFHSTIDFTLNQIEINKKKGEKRSFKMLSVNFPNRYERSQMFTRRKKNMSKE